ncbi:MAG TPA: UbiD family decarboxylase [Bacillota bacterium]
MTAEIHDLRSFLKVLEDVGQLTRIDREVDLHDELGAVLQALERAGLGAGYFSRVKDRSMPVVGGLLGSVDRIALALGCAKPEIVDRMGAALDPRNAIEPTLVDSAPFQTNVMRKDVDLGRLSIPKHAPGDAGPFITGGVVVSRDPDGTRQNLSYQRMQVKGPDKLGLMINEWRHLKGFVEKTEARGQALPFAVAIGLDPAISIAAGCRYDDDELAVAGAIRGRPVPVVKGLTSDILVPAEAEIIIEAEIPPGVREDEGPLAEFTGHYGAPWPSWVARVKAIQYRDGAIFQTIAGASFEHVNLGNVLPREPLIKRFVSHVAKNVRAVHIPPYGSGFMALVAIDKVNPGEPKNVALAAMTAHVNLKNVVVFDGDVNIFDPADVLWALNTRVKADRDVFVVPFAQGHELDPTSDKRGVQTKLGIDATQKDERGEILQRARYPEIDLSRYLK